MNIPDLCFAGSVGHLVRLVSGPEDLAQCAVFELGEELQGTSQSRHLLFNPGTRVTLRQLTGVPNPVTGSHPFKAGKPSVLHPFAEPLTISVKAV